MRDHRREGGFEGGLKRERETIFRDEHFFKVLHNSMHAQTFCPFDPGDPMFPALPFSPTSPWTHAHRELL